MIDAALDGRLAFSLSGSKTLTSTDYLADESRMRFLDVTGGTRGTVTIPAVEKLYLVRNATSGSVIVTIGSGVTATVLAGNTNWVACDGTNVRLVEQSRAAITSGTITGITIWQLPMGERVREQPPLLVPIWA